MSEAGKGGLLILNEKDNVGVTPVPLGDVPAGHKIALCEIPQGGAVIKYGQVIGRATKPIRAGEWVHSHNLRSHLDEEPSYSYDFSAEVPVGERGSFPGYLRRDGSVGIRNEIYIIPTVGCVNSICRRLEKMAQKLERLA